MAQMLEVSCGACGAEEVQLDGPVMTGYLPRCKQCGETCVVPPNGGPGSAGLGDEALAAWIAQEAGTCSCAGRFSVNAPLRCGACRSTDVTTTFVGMAD